MTFLSYYKSYLYNYVQHRYQYGLTTGSYTTLLSPIAAYKAYKQRERLVAQAKLHLHN